MTFIVATNVVTSRPPERQPTGTPHTCAKMNSVYYLAVTDGFSREFASSSKRQEKVNNRSVPT